MTTLVFEPQERKPWWDSHKALLVGAFVAGGIIAGLAAYTFVVAMSDSIANSMASSLKATTNIARFLPQ